MAARAGANAGRRIFLIATEESGDSDKALDLTNDLEAQHEHLSAKVVQLELELRKALRRVNELSKTPPVASEN